MALSFAQQDGVPFKGQFVVTIREVIFVFDVASGIRYAERTRTFIGVSYPTYRFDATGSFSPLSFEGSF